jgi:signal transduction histidine kinase
VYEALTLVRPLWLDVPNLTIDVALGPTPAVEVDPLTVRQVLINLLLNALTVMPDGGTLTIRSDTLGPLVSISITDTGPGLSPDVQATLFAPLMSNRLNGRGLGLVSSRALIMEAGGSLTAVNTPGAGATFTLTLPAAV